MKLPLRILLVVVSAAGSSCVGAELMPPRGGSSTFKGMTDDAHKGEVGVYVHLCGACSLPYAGQIRRARELLERTCRGDFTLVSEGPSWGGNACSAEIGGPFSRHYCWNARCRGND